jgi:uncharacterized protein
MENRINWFEIPATDLKRARKFYSTVFAVEMQTLPEYEELAVSEFEGVQSVFFPDSGGVSGCLAQGKGYVPSHQGTLVYLNGGSDLSVVLERVEAAGGRVELPKISIGEHGFIAIFIDTEGNRVGLHSTG